MNKLQAWLLTIVALVGLDLASIVTARIPTCMIDAANYGDYYAHNNECPAFHVFLVKSFARIFEAIGHEWLTAIATAIIAIFTVVLVIVTNRQARLTLATIELARDEFLSTHRPRMRLKHMWLTPDFDWRRGEPLEVTLDIVNVGSSEGFITWVNFDSVLIPRSERLSQRPPYDEVPPGPDTRTTRFQTNILLGVGITTPRTVCDGRTLDAKQVHDVLQGNQELYLIGTIEYWDAKKALRQTGFCRLFTFNSNPPGPNDSGRFDVYKDPDYEFED